MQQNKMYPFEVREVNAKTGTMIVEMRVGFMQALVETIRVGLQARCQGEPLVKSLDSTSKSSVHEMGISLLLGTALQGLLDPLVNREQREVPVAPDVFPRQRQIFAFAGVVDDARKFIYSNGAISVEELGSIPDRIIDHAGIEHEPSTEDCTTN